MEAQKIVFAFLSITNTSFLSLAPPYNGHFRSIIRSLVPQARPLPRGSKNKMLELLETAK